VNRVKKRYIVIAIVLLVLLSGFIAVKVILGRTEASLKNLAASEIADVDLTSAEDGYYLGSCSVFPVSVEVKVTIKSHAITEIDLLKHDNGQGQGAEIIPEKVIEAQSLQVDSITGATYSSKVILKAIQDALKKAVSGTVPDKQ
jgi:uncharacterized protein with FMN-binding domain